MTQTRSRKGRWAIPWAGLLLALLAAGALAGCSGVAATTPAGNSGPSSSSPSASLPGSPAAGAGVDVGQASQTLANLSSYQAHTQTPAQSADIVVVRSPTLAESIVATVGTRRERLVVIGPDVWRDAGTGTFIKNAITPGTAAGILGLFDPGAIVTAFAKEHPLTGLVEVGRESRNGVDTVHFHGDPSSTGGGGATIPAGGVIDVWVASQGGELVGLEATGLKLSGKSGTVSIELSHINDPAIAVQPPG